MKFFTFTKIFAPMNKTPFIILFCAITIIACKRVVIIPENQVPVAEAGANDTITLPKDVLTLNGSGKDADGEIVAYLWSQKSGPAASVIEDPGAASTQVTDLIAGNYVFQLMVTDDKGATGVDTVSITVKELPTQTLTLQPTNNPDEIGVTLLNGANSTGISPEISIDAWTTGGKPWILRDVFKFDLSAIPANAIIKTANLYLYSNPKPLTGNLVDANFGSDNGLSLQQVTSDWSPLTIGWFNQPSTDTLHQMLIPSTNEPFLDLNLDVTSMISSMVNNNANYGFLLKLQDEVIYNSRIFVSSYNTSYPDKHPKLVISYQ